ncbi:hypothetical protein BDR05DRAFT_947869 [Suillus weaverae]|nr:hypothetical protein BDR05DRAFT_947869 [Suillus weaverae]
MPQNVKKSFSVSSDSIKEWMSTGFEFFAEWAKGDFCVIQQLIKTTRKRRNVDYLNSFWMMKAMYNFLLVMVSDLRINKNSYKLFFMLHTTFSLVVYLEASLVPDNFLICDSSHMRAKDINVIWKYWESQSMAKKSLVTFIKARPLDMRLKGSKRDKASFRKVKPCEELDLPPWADWGWEESYLPENLHEYEEDEALPGTPFYLGSSIMDLQCMTKVDKVVSHTASEVVGLIEVAMRTTSLHSHKDKENDEDKDKDKEQVEDKEQEDEEEDKDKDKEQVENKEQEVKEEVKDKEEESKEKDKEKDQEDEQEEIQEVEKEQYQGQKQGQPKGKKKVYSILTWIARLALRQHSNHAGQGIFRSMTPCPWNDDSQGVMSSQVGFASIGSLHRTREAGQL